MNEKAAALCAKIRRFSANVEGMCAGIERSTASKRMIRRVTSATTAVVISYAAASEVTRAEDFIPHIAAAARHAKRARHLLQDLVLMDYVAIGNTRDLILEARGLEAILRVARNTARRHRAARQRGGSAGGRVAKNPFGADRQASE
ncbi:MAG TPA: hypothetical protein VKH34_12360 [Vicinamibacterales bacterium]|nr:hypothetical protein [Vicinamibacterales bacterium]